MSSKYLCKKKKKTQNTSNLCSLSSIYKEDIEFPQQCLEIGLEDQNNCNVNGLDCLSMRYMVYVESHIRCLLDLLLIT